MTLASFLADAHRTGRPFPASSAPAPASFEEAEAVQAEVAGLLGAKVAGWKVGIAPDGSRPAAAPLFRHLILEDAGAFAVEQATFLAIEVEIGFRLQSGANDALDRALGSAFVGIEIIRSRYTEGPAVPFTSFLADNIGNAGYVAGSQPRDWRALDLAQLRCRVWRDGELVHDRVGGHPQGHPLVPLEAQWFVPPTRLGGFRGGQIVTTGTLCGVMRIDAPCRIRADVEGFGEVSVTLQEGQL